MEPTCILRLAKGEDEELSRLLARATELAGVDPDAPVEEWLPGLQRRIDAGDLEPGDVDAIAAGFGQILAARADLQWRIYLDSDGLEFVVQQPGTTAVCFPFHMLRNRFDDGREVDLAELVEGTRKALLQGKSAAAAWDDEWEQCVYGLRQVDITIERKDGSIILVVVTMGRLTDDARHLFLLARKIDGHRRHLLSGALGPLDKVRPTIRVNLAEEPDAAVLRRIEELRAAMEPEGITLDLARRF